MKKVLFSLMAIVLCLGIMGSAFAYFTDTETSIGNTFTSGVAVLAMSDGGAYKTDGSVVIGTAANMAPGQTVGPFDVYFKNVGTVSGVVSVTMSYAAAPSPGTLPDGAPSCATATTTQFAKKLIVAHAESDLNPVFNVAPFWALQIAETTGDGTWATAVANGYIVSDSTSGLFYPYLPTIDGLSKVTLRFTDGYGGPDMPLAPNAVHWEKMSLKLDSSATNPYAWMGVTITVNATITSN